MSKCLSFWTLNTVYQLYKRNVEVNSALRKYVSGLDLVLSIEKHAKEVNLARCETAIFCGEAHLPSDDGRAARPGLPGLVHPF